MTEASARVLLTHVIDAAERIYRLEKGTLVGERKFYDLVEIRRLVYLVGRVWLGKSFPEIGRRLARDHSTVLHHVRAAAVALDDRLLSNAQRLIDVAMGLAGAGRLSVGEWADLVPWLMAGLPKPVDKQKTADKSQSLRSGSTKPPPQNPDADHYGRHFHQWFRDNNARFIAAMREAHPEKEIVLQRVE